jgi:hypothetical protein
LNRTLCLSVPTLEDQIGELQNTAEAIVTNISPDLGNNKIFTILSRAYQDFKRFIINIKKRKALIQFLKQNENLNDEKKSFDEIEILREFKKILKKEKKIKTEFFGNRDFYNIIKSVAFEVSKLKDPNEDKIKDITENFIERNFGGIKYEFDLSFKFKLDVKNIENEIRRVLGDEKFDEKKK